MKIMGMGMDLSGKLLFGAVEEETFAKNIIESLDRNISAVRALGTLTSQGLMFKGELQREALDIGDPISVGWTYVADGADPNLAQIQKILEPLAKKRGMGAPMILDNREGGVFDWIYENYFSLILENKKVPHFVMLVGGPDRVPFQFQYVLDTVASVGRVDFDTLDDLDAYVQKLLRLEADKKPTAKKEAIVFGPDAGLPDPTYFSRLYMAEPLADHIKSTLGFKVSEVFGQDATKSSLGQILQSGNPALVYAASHGLGAVGEKIEIQRQYNGAICCQHIGTLKESDLYSALDVPIDKPLLEGAVFFQFACFGYGTPSQSDYSHWIDGVPENYTDTDFTAALPKRLLAHPRGPIAFIGHLDTAFLHGFVDVEAPHILDRWHSRISPFVDAVNQLLRTQPIGQAMENMNKRYSVLNALITNTYDREKRGKLKWDSAKLADFLSRWIERSDAQNYMVFGDPAARLRFLEE